MKRFWNKFVQVMNRPAKMGDVVQGALPVVCLVTGQYILAGVLAFIWLARLVATA